MPTTRRLSQLSRRSGGAGATEDEISDKIEIDSDNIETPPAQRRLFSPAKDVKLADKDLASKRDIRTTTSAVTPGRDTSSAYTDLGSGEFLLVCLVTMIDLLVFETMGWKR